MPCSRSPEGSVQRGVPAWGCVSARGGGGVCSGDVHGWGCGDPLLRAVRILLECILVFSTTLIICQRLELVQRLYFILSPSIGSIEISLCFSQK